jgi:hypothetical protein
MRIVVTKELIESLMTAKGGWTRDHLKLFGVDWPPARGWKAAITGRVLDVDVSQLPLHIPVDITDEDGRPVVRYSPRCFRKRTSH